MAELAQRLNHDQQKLIFDRVEELVLGGATLIWIPLGFLASLWLKRRLFTVAWLAGGFIGPLVFFNLYWIHDYYLIALTPMAAAAVGIGLVWTARRWKWIEPPLLGAVLVCRSVFVSANCGRVHACSCLPMACQPW